MNVSEYGSHCHLVMIRFNLDGYVWSEEGKIPSPWTDTKKSLCTLRSKWKKAWEARLQLVRNRVGYWMKNQSDKLIICRGVVLLPNICEL